MCRLLGVVSATPISVAQAVGEHVLKDFVALTKIHGDGWGVGARPAARSRPARSRCRRVPRSTIRTSPRRPMTDGRPQAWSTCAGRRPGLAVRPENSHPFLADRIAMAHNGSIKPIDAPRRTARTRDRRDDARHHRQRTLLRRHPPAPRVGAGSAPRRSARAVSQLRELYPDASLNALILGEDQLIAVHAHARSRLPDEDIAEITAADLPAEHLEDYFAMRWARPDEDTGGHRVDGLRRPRLAPAAVGERHGDLDVRPVDGVLAADDSVDAMTDEPSRRGPAPHCRR